MWTTTQLNTTHLNLDNVCPFIGFSIYVYNSWNWWFRDREWMRVRLRLWSLLFLNSLWCSLTCALWVRHVDGSNSLMRLPKHNFLQIFFCDLRQKRVNRVSEYVYYVVRSTLCQNTCIWDQQLDSHLKGQFFANLFVILGKKVNSRVS